MMPFRKPQLRIERTLHLSPVKREGDLMTKDEMASALHVAWGRYKWLFGEEPHGTLKQIKALVGLVHMPTQRTTPESDSTISTTHENPKSDDN